MILYPTVTFTLHLHRQPLYYVVNLIIPCCFFSFIAVATFLLQPGCFERLGIGTNLFTNTEKPKHRRAATACSMPIGLYPNCCREMEGKERKKTGKGREEKGGEGERNWRKGERRNEGRKRGGKKEMKRNKWEGTGNAIRGKWEGKESGKPSITIH